MNHNNYFTFCVNSEKITGKGADTSIEIIYYLLPESTQVSKATEYHLGSVLIF